MNVRRVVVAVALITALSLFLAGTNREASATVTGTHEGQAFTLGGSLIGSDLSIFNSVDLPPGGTEALGPVDEGVPAVFNLHADAIEVHCEGVAWNW
jgi:hypothetical protein